MAFDKQKIRTTTDRPIEGPFIIPEWDNAEVYVRAMSGKQRDQYDMANVSDRAAPNVRGLAVAIALTDKDGNRLFEDGDAGWLSEKSGSVMTRLFTEIARVSGLGGDDGEKKGSAPAPSA